MPRLHTCPASATDRNVLVAPTQHNPKLAAWRQSIQASAAPVQATCSSAPKRPVSQQLLAGLAATAVSLQLGGPAMAFTTSEPVPLPLMMEQQQAPIVSQLGLYEQAQVQEDFMTAPALAAPSLEDVLVPTSLLTDLESVADSAFIDSLKSVVEDSISATNLAEANFTAVGASPSNGSRWMSQGPLCYVWEAYCSSLTERPMFTKMLTGMLGTLLGDLLAQGLAAATRGSSDSDAASSSAGSSSRSTAGGKGGSGEQGAAVQKQAPGLPSLDWGRTARLVGYSALVGTPLAALWYNFLDASVFPADPQAPAAIVAKMALDQLVNAPIMTSVFFAAMCFVEGRPGDALQDVRTKLKPTLMASYCLWPVAHIINFGFIDPQNRILYINSINIGWTAFMSHMASSSKDAASTEQPAAAPARALSSRTVSSRS